MSEDFSNWNWVVLVLYLGGVFAIGIKARKHQKSSEDFFLAGRSMGYLPLGLSMCMTIFSAISYQAIPNQSYYFGMLLMMSMLMIWVDLPVIALIVFPIFYRLRLYSIYEYLEMRFGLAMRSAASMVFFFWRLFWLATVIYAPCKALQVVLEIATGTRIPVQSLVITVGIVTTIYTFLGGMRAVIWTDVAQFCVMAGSVVAIIAVVWSSMSYDPAEVWQVAREGGRTIWAHTRFDLQDPWCIWGIVPFYFLARLSFYSADQINVQRALAARSLGQAQKAFALNCLCLTLFIPILCYVGLNLYAFYQTHPERIPQEYQKVELAPGEDAWGVQHPDTGERLEDKILPTFVARELPVGIAGLVLSALFAACMSTMDSGLNSVATSLIVDFHRRLGVAKKWLANRVGKPISDLDEADELKLARPVVIFLGAIATAGGCIVGQLGTIFEIARSALDTPGIPLACVFLLGMLTRRANMTGAFAGLTRALTSDVAIVTAASLLTQSLAAQILQLNESLQRFDAKIEELFNNHPDPFIFNSLPGSGKALAPRLFGVFGEDRDRFQSAAEVQTVSGVAPLQRNSGKTRIVCYRWACPKFVRQGVHEFAAHSRHWCPWAQAFYQMKVSQGKDHHVAVRSLAFKWLRIIYRCWKNRVPYDDAIYMDSLKANNSPLLAFL